MTKKRSTMLADKAQTWRTVKVTGEAYERIADARQPHDSMNDPIERAFGIKRGDRVRKIAANMAAKLKGERKNKNKKTNKTKGKK